MELLVATSNPGKIREFQSLLHPFRCIGQETLGIESPEETGLTFVENALIKARHAAKMGQRPALADDSGLVVEALNGSPGIYSARYAGSHANSQDNMALVLKSLQGLPKKAREAYFYCVLVYLRHALDPTPLIAVGRLSGVIAETVKGEGGFGYDPIFYLPEWGFTVAELDSSVKNTISHRAKAIAALKALLDEALF